MFSQLILQLSALHLCFAQSEERKQMKRKKIQENGFPAGEPAAMLVSACARTSLVAMCDRKLFQGLVIEFNVYCMCWWSFSRLKNSVIPSLFP
jgi:hypothetical protein